MANGMNRLLRAGILADDPTFFQRREAAERSALASELSSARAELTAMKRRQFDRQKLRIGLIDSALQRLPADHPSRPKLERQFEEMTGIQGIGAGTLPKIEKPDLTAGERRRNRLIDLVAKEQAGTTLAPREKLELGELRKEQAKATTITGLTEQDIAVRDPVRRRRLKGFIQGNADVKAELTGIVEDIQQFPSAVGGIAGGREAIGGIIGQVGDLLESESLARLSEAISPEQLTAIRTRAAGLRTALLPIFTGDESRYTDRDMAIVTENLKVLETTADSRQAVTALSTIAAIVSARDKEARRELQEGFNETFLSDKDIDRGGPQVGVIYPDADGNRAIYLGKNPANPRDPVNWRQVGAQ